MQSGSWWRVAVSAEGDTVMELTTTVIASTWPLWPPRHWLLIRSGDMKARTNEGGQITINQTTTADTGMFTQTQLCCMMLLCYCRSILMTTAGRRRGDVWLALMIGLRCDARCDTSWWWDYPPRDECDTLWQLSQILTHTWQMCNRSAAQKVHRGNFQGCRRIFNEITLSYFFLFAVNDCQLW